MILSDQPVSMNQTTGSRRIVQIGLLLAVCLAIYANTFPNAFVWDDPYLIVDNRYIKHSRNIPLFFTPYYWNALHPYADIQVQYRPVRTTSFALDYFFWKDNPAGYHLTNLLLHMINVVLVFYLATALGAVSAKGPEATASGCKRNRVLMSLPFLAAVLFATHPVHTESVTYIKNRSELLAFMFFLAAFLLFVRVYGYRRMIPRLLMLGGSLLCFVLAMLSKETALVLPAILVLYLFCFRDRTEWGRTLIRVLPFVAAAISYLWFVHALLNNDGLTPSSFRIDAGRHVLAVLATIAEYLGLLAFPIHLNAEHPFSIPASAADPVVVLCLMGLMLTGFLIVRSWRRSRLVCFSILFILLTLLPASNIIFLWSRPLAEQRLYIPSLGFCLLLAAGIVRLYDRASTGSGPKVIRATVLLLTGVILAGYAIKTIDRNRDWRDPVTFYTRTLAGNPDSARMHNNLGRALSEQGRRREAIVHYETAMRLDPTYPHVYNNLGVELAESGRLQEAIARFETALQLDPKYASAHTNLGIALLEIGAARAALDHYRAAARLKPDAEMLNNLGSASATLGLQEEAVNSYLAALRIEPDYMLALNNLGALLTETENAQWIVDQFLKPVMSPWQLARVFNSAATIFLKAEDRASAEAYFQKAVGADPDYIDGLYNLGLVLALENKYRAAADVYARILAARPGEAEAQRRYGICLNLMTAETAPSGS